MANAYKVRESEKAFGIVMRTDIKEGVGILWVPKSKMVFIHETDELSKRIITNKGTFNGTPVDVIIDDEFRAKLDLA